ncbi:hypothetical protein F4823DRAFT_485440 [Ustulina deusta]|nr:hypothetical protein F4823DRAFT_485440 [Ustulina deusta]
MQLAPGIIMSALRLDITSVVILEFSSFSHRANTRPPWHNNSQHLISQHQKREVHSEKPRTRQWPPEPLCIYLPNDSPSWRKAGTNQTKAAATFIDLLTYSQVSGPEQAISHSEPTSIASTCTSSMRSNSISLHVPFHHSSLPSQVPYRAQTAMSRSAHHGSDGCRQQGRPVPCFQRFCAFDLEYVRDVQHGDGTATMLWAFGSCRCQAKCVEHGRAV